VPGRIVARARHNGTLTGRVAIQYLNTARLRDTIVQHESGKKWIEGLRGHVAINKRTVVFDIFNRPWRRGVISSECRGENCSVQNNGKITIFLLKLLTYRRGPC
jgi:hypothetical protein